MIAISLWIAVFERAAERVWRCHSAYALAGGGASVPSRKTGHSVCAESMYASEAHDTAAKSADAAHSGANAPCARGQRAHE